MSLKPDETDQYRVWNHETLVTLNTEFWKLRDRVIVLETRAGLAGFLAGLIASAVVAYVAKKL